MTIDHSDICVTPGPSDYETRVNSCIKESAKQTSFTTASRWGTAKPLVNPDAPLYDTRPSSYLLHKTAARVRITEAKREISPHLFHAKNSHAFQKGVYLKPWWNGTLNSPYIKYKLLYIIRSKYTSGYTYTQPKVNKNKIQKWSQKNIIHSVNELIYNKQIINYWCSLFF